MKMKRIVLTIAAAAAVCLSAGAQNQQAMNGKKTLVAYFSATGITEKVAEMIILWESGLELQPGYYDMDLNLSLWSK